MTREQEFRWRDWVVTGVQGVRSAVASPRRLLPEAFWGHSRAACREALLAARSLLDAAIAQTEKKPKPVTRIKVGKAE